MYFHERLTYPGTKRPGEERGNKGTMLCYSGLYNQWGNIYMCLIYKVAWGSGSHYFTQCTGLKASIYPSKLDGTHKSNAPRHVQFFCSTTLLCLIHDFLVALYFRLFSLFLSGFLSDGFFFPVWLGFRILSLFGFYFTRFRDPKRREYTYTYFYFFIFSLLTVYPLFCSPWQWKGSAEAGACHDVSRMPPKTVVGLLEEVRTSTVSRTTAPPDREQNTDRKRFTVGIYHLQAHDT